MNEDYYLLEGEFYKRYILHKIVQNRKDEIKHIKGGYLIQDNAYFLQIDMITKDDIDIIEGYTPVHYQITSVSNKLSQIVFKINLFDVILDNKLFKVNPKVDCINCSICGIPFKIVKKGESELCEPGITIKNHYEIINVHEKYKLTLDHHRRWIELWLGKKLSEFYTE